MHSNKDIISKLAVFLFSSIATIQGSLAQGTGSGVAALEEIVVTAQRREQSIQEVPISLEAFSGADLVKQGLRTLEDLSNFSPSVEIDVRMQDQDIAIRGLGTTGNNLGLEQAVPVFVDGVHYGRTSMIMGNFLDMERVEILRGPQPVYFGQNATAGAFSLTTRKPGPELQGDITAEYGNFGRMSVEGGIGGPITDTLGIRVAGQYDRISGWIRDIVTDDIFPKEENTSGRVTLQWAPSEAFEATLKAEYAKRAREGDGNVVCRTLGNPALDQNAVIIPGLTAFDDVITVAPIPDDCDKGFRRVGIQTPGRNIFKPVPGIINEDARAGIIDTSTVIGKLIDDTVAHDDMTAYNYRLGLVYTFANESIIESSTAYVDYQRATFEDNRPTPIVTNTRTRGEIFDMFSQDFRFVSPRGGMLEWEAGVYYQMEDLDLGNVGDFNNPEQRYITQSMGAQIRQPVRISGNWQDAEWMSAYGSLTFNFLDEKASLDVGARYTDVSKDSHAEGFARTWIFDINPIDPGTGRANSTDPNGTIRNVASSMINCATGNIQCGTYGAGFWTAAYNTRDIPDVWNTRAPVDAGPILSHIRTDHNIWDRDYSETSLDPQVTLRYRPSDDTSLYAKWARAFKGGGANVATGGIPNSEDGFFIEAEHAETFEVGAKGSLLDGTANYNLTVFQITVDDLQIATNQPTALGGVTETANAGKQRTRGIEMDALWAVTDRLTLGFNGAIMDGVMVEYTGAGCSDFEFENAETGACLTAAESIAAYGSDDFEGTIDRSGEQAPRTPDWKFGFDLDYWYPVFDNHKLTFSTKATYSDTYILNVEDFDEIVKYDKRIVANLNLGVGDQGDVWALTFWIRNLLSEGIEYFPEFDVVQEGIISYQVSPRNFTTYGVQYQYNYN